MSAAECLRPISTFAGLRSVRPGRELLDPAEGGREEQRLAVLRAFLDDPPDVGKEAHVQHPVDLVQDEDVDLVEGAVPLLQVVQEAAGGRCEDVHPAPEVLGLLPVADAAVHDRHPQVGELAYLWEGLPRPGASSRVGSRMSSASRRGFPGADDREREGGGPCPRRALRRPMTSRPSRMSGIAWDWIGVGSV